MDQRDRVQPMDRLVRRVRRSGHVDLGRGVGVSHVRGGEVGGDPLRKAAAGHGAQRDRLRPPLLGSRWAGLVPRAPALVVAEVVRVDHGER